MTFVKKIDTNEYPNIFASKKITRMNIRIYSYNKFDTTECLKKIFVLKIVRILEYIQILIQFSILISIRTFARVKFVIRIYSDIRSCNFLMQIYLDIRSCRNFYECHTLA